MDFNFSQETLAWREELRSFLREILPGNEPGADDFFDNEEQAPFAKEFMKKFLHYIQIELKTGVLLMNLESLPCKDISQGCFHQG